MDNDLDNIVIHPKVPGDGTPGAQAVSGLLYPVLTFGTFTMEPVYLKGIHPL